MPKSITIRNVSDETSAELAVRAAAKGQSLQEYVLGELDRIAQFPDPETWVARVRSRKAAQQGGLSVGQVLALRDADRR